MIVGDIYGYRTHRALVDAMEVESAYRLGNKLRGGSAGCGAYRETNQGVEALDVELSIFGCGIIIYHINVAGANPTRGRIQWNPCLYLELAPSIEF